jgi:hypothetical protein
VKNEGPDPSIFPDKLLVNNKEETKLHSLHERRIAMALPHLQMQRMTNDCFCSFSNIAID